MTDSSILVLSGPSDYAWRDEPESCRNLAKGSCGDSDRHQVVRDACPVRGACDAAVSFVASAAHSKRVLEPRNTRFTASAPRTSSSEGALPLAFEPARRSMPRFRNGGTSDAHLFDAAHILHLEESTVGRRRRRISSRPAAHFFECHLR